jgi:thiol-disulfide isomerase/thioredoxin
MRLYKISIIAIALSLLLIGCSAQREKGHLSNLNISDIELESLDGQAVDLESMEGRTVFINFWATWCKPCLLEMPTIEKAQAELKAQNVVFLFPSSEDIDQINDFKIKREFDLNYVRVLNMEDLNIQAFPTTFIFNEEGKLIFSEPGFRDWSTQENMNLIKPKTIN